MKVKTTMRQMKDAKVAFISLVARGANRIPFRVIKSEGDEKMLDLSQLRHVFKSEPIHAKSPSFAAILGNGKQAPRSEATPRTPAATGQSIARQSEPIRDNSAQAATALKTDQQKQQRAQEQQQLIQEERQRQELAPNQALHMPARRGANTPKQPAPSRSAEKSMEQTVSEALAVIQAHQHKQTEVEKMRAWSEERSAYSRIAPTPRTGSAAKATWKDAGALRNFGGHLATMVMGSHITKAEGPQRLPSGSMRAVSGDSLKA